MFSSLTLFSKGTKRGISRHRLYILLIVLTGFNRQVFQKRETVHCLITGYMLRLSSNVLFFSLLYFFNANVHFQHEVHHSESEEQEAL